MPAAAPPLAVAVPYERIGELLVREGQVTRDQLANAQREQKQSGTSVTYNLVKLGYMTVTDGRFTLSPRVLELGYAYLSSLSLPEVAQPHMEALVEAVKEIAGRHGVGRVDIMEDRVLGLKVGMKF